ncbi:MAG: DASS family sodium-coupled anion symporter [Candidatus Omnitrophica bacterium]|nr:Sodium-dependent dicarboxylate transporter SdcS [bacterium]NUN98657.1 DASS family sodium-coupled anion symporter [Candidatus Omnitrophota bacterium]
MTEPEERLSRAEERFEEIRRSVGLWLGPVVFLALLATPFPNLSPAAHHLAAILGLVLIYWICEPIPLPVTALLGPCLCVVFRIADAKELLACFSDPVIYVFLGSFLLAEAMMVHGLDRRIALSVLSLRWVGNSVFRVLFVFGGIAAALSLWLSNTATTAMLLPVAIGILSEVGALHGEGQSGETSEPPRRISRGLLLLTAYGASVGGLGTPIGTPPNLIGIGMIHKLLGVQISFTDWMKLAVPVVVVMYLALFGLILLLHSPELRRVEGMAAYFKERRRSLGPWTRGQVNALLAFLVAVTLWLVPGVLGLFGGINSAILSEYQARVPEGIAAILAASLLFILPVDWRARRFTLSWREATRIDWGTMLLFGGGIALGSLAFSTGLAEALGRVVLETTGVRSLSGITFLSILLAIILSETTSNTASANMMIPVAIAVARAAGVDPILPALGACMGASYGFMLPVSTPPNALVYGTGRIPISSMIKTGVVFDVIGLFLIWGALMLGMVG